MIHLAAMSEFVHDHVVDDSWWMMDQPPVEVEIPLTTTAAPAAFLLTQGYAAVGNVHGFGELVGAG